MKKQSNKEKKIIKQIKGITLVSLVITIIVLLILAGVTINLIKDGGIITEAQNAAKMSRLANTREQISMDILAAQMADAMKGEELNKDQITEIVNKYGELDEDGDTIKTDDGDLSLKDILEGNNDIPEDQKKKIAELENRIKDLEKAIEDLNKQLEDERNDKAGLEEEIANLRKELEDKQAEIDELNRQLAEKNEKITELESTVETLNNTIETLNTQIADLKSKQATGNAGVADVLTGKTFSNSSGVGLTGTMPAYTSGSTAVTASGKWGFDTTYGPWLYAPNNAYYGTGHWFNIPWATIKGSLGDAAAGNVLTGKTFTSTNGVKIAGSMPNRGALNWAGSNTTYTVPAGYYSGGTLNSKPSYTNGYNAGVTAADNRANTNSTNYKTGYNAGVAAKASNYKTGTWTIGSSGTQTLNVGFQPNVFLCFLGINTHDSFVGGYCSLSGASINVGAGLLGTGNKGDMTAVWTVTSTGISISSTSAIAGKTVTYIAAQIK